MDWRDGHCVGVRLHKVNGMTPCQGFSRGALGGNECLAAEGQKSDSLVQYKTKLRLLLPI